MKQTFQALFAIATFGKKSLKPTIRVDLSIYSAKTYGMLKFTPSFVRPGTLLLVNGFYHTVVLEGFLVGCFLWGKWYQRGGHKTASMCLKCSPMMYVLQQLQYFLSLKVQFPLAFSCFIHSGMKFLRVFGLVYFDFCSPGRFQLLHLCTVSIAGVSTKVSSLSGTPAAGDSSLDEWQKQ